MLWHVEFVVYQMKTLGIIGGLGPESTLDYYQRIIALYRERMRDGHYPEFIIVSVDLRKGLDFMDASDLSGMADFLLEAIGKLARAGAEFGIISANTPHIVFDDVAPKSPIPLISIVEATCAAAKAQNLKRLALFGTRYTMQANFYPKVFKREGIELARAGPARPGLHPRQIHERIGPREISARHPCRATGHCRSDESEERHRRRDSRRHGTAANPTRSRPQRHSVSRYNKDPLSKPQSPKCSRD